MSRIDEIDMIDDEMYEYYKTKHEDMENHVIDHVVFNYFEMYIKMDNGVELVYDADYDKFSTLETRHKLALILRKFIKEKHFSLEVLSKRFGLSIATLRLCKRAEYKLGEYVSFKITQKLECSIDEYYEKYVKGDEMNEY